MVAVVPLKYGTAFKKAFSDPEVFRGFIRDIVGVDLQIDKVEQEKGFSPVFGRVDIHYDLFAEDKKHRAIAEIQHIRESDTFDRFLFYHMIAQAEQIRSGEDYHFARTVYTVVVLTRLPDDPRYQFDIAVHDSDLRDTPGPAHER